MKPFYKTILLFFLCCYLPATASESRISIYGNFIQPWLYNNWADEQWEEEFAYMEALGMEAIIMGDVAYLDVGATEWYTFYPSTIPDTRPISNDVETIFKQASKYGIKLYIGMGCAGNWWSWNLSKEQDASEFFEAMRKSCLFAKELYEIYQPRYPETFAGFYSVYEIWNHVDWNQEDTRNTYAKNLSAAFNLLIDSLNKIDPELPLLFSPFATIADWCSTKENTQAFYELFFTKTNFRSQDGMLPMDNVGGGGQNIHTVEEWTKMYADAISNSGNKLNYYANVESFVQPEYEKLYDTPETPRYGIEYCGSAPVGRFIKQIEIAQKYATKIFNFAFSHYYSPNNAIPGFYDALIDYIETGDADTEFPSTPHRVEFGMESVLNTATQQMENILKITWEGAADDYGVSRVNLYKETKNVAYRVAIRADVHYQQQEPPFMYYPEYTEDDAAYRLGVVDVWGNESFTELFELDLTKGYADLTQTTSISEPISQPNNPLYCYINKDRNVEFLFNSPKETKKNVTLFSASGVTLYQSKIKIEKGTNKITLPFKSYVPVRFFVYLEDVN